VAREGVHGVQASLRKKLQSGEIRLQAYDTPEGRQNLLLRIMALFIAAGMTMEEAEAATMEFIESQVANETYYREKNVFVRYGTAGYYTRNSDSSLARWATFSVDFFNPVEDVMFFTDLAEDAIRGTTQTLQTFDEVISGATGDIAKSVQTIQTDPNAYINLRRQMLKGGPALPEKSKPKGKSSWLRWFFWGD